MFNNAGLFWATIHVLEHIEEYFCERSEKTALVSLLALYIPLSQAAATEYSLDPQHTSVVIAWNHFGFSNPTAYISDVSGKISFDKENPEKSSVNVTLPVKTIDTHVKALTDEFLGKDYFDVKTFPEATFQSTRVVSKGGNKYDVEGNLTIKGMTKPVLLHATLNKQDMHPMVKKQAIGFDATGVIKRSDFKLDKYVPAVSDNVTITLSTEAYAQ
ncbi:YceI family protein [Klebsiella africana]|uniref:YceI family protein n=1 Tax=Klebsiella africana TaxID=2489010 RepID=A0ACD4AUZ6_9ENTR|nr:YceI family protein [Klebsiella africana]USB43614.1 YceI family protein [Klebsiella africana]